MNKRSSFLFCLVLYFLLNAGTTLATGPEKNKKQAENVNLALRQVGHHLLKIAGDTESTIPPVQMISQSKFSLKLDRAFNYDTLPHLLHQAFIAYDITNDYQVAIKKCDADTIILGYNHTAYSNDQVACMGRKLVADCNVIVVTLEEQIEVTTDKTSFWPPFILLGLIALFGVRYFSKKGSSEADTLTSSSPTVIPLGNFSFDYKNQTLLLGEEQKSLTFRENKLLNFLANHTNEVLSRDIIVAEVWGDEGVIVGRSLDVFISRLRKLLKADTSVVIKTIHGVGYRLEVTNG